MRNREERMQDQYNYIKGSTTEEVLFIIVSLMAFASLAYAFIYDLF